MPSPPLKVTELGASGVSLVLPQKPALGRRYEAFRHENRLGRSQSLFDDSCIDGFTAGLTIQRRRRHPCRRQSFSSFWEFFVFNSYYDKKFLNDRQGLIPKHIIYQQFYSRQLLEALARSAAKISASVIPWIGGGGGS
jgi:hypothetical protein